MSWFLRAGAYGRAPTARPTGKACPIREPQLRDLLVRAVFSPVFWGEALYAPPVSRRFVVRSAPAIERVGAAFGLPFAGVHIVEAIKQVHRPVGARAVRRTRLVPLNPALALERAAASVIDGPIEMSVFFERRYAAFDIGAGPNP